jgi:hypothetical protein
MYKRVAAVLAAVVLAGSLLSGAPSTVPIAEAAEAGALGVTFGFTERTMYGGPYESGVNQILNLPLYLATTDEAKFWDNYVEELLSAGVDFVAPTIRGYSPDKPNWSKSGDPRKLAGLVEAIKRKGATDRLKISALDDTPASMTDRKNLEKHNKGGYSPPFDLGDTSGTGEGGYKYIWDQNLRAFFQTVPDELRFKIDGRPVIYEWSMNTPFFTNQGNGNTRRMAEYIHQRAQAEFNVNPYLIVDNSWLNVDPTVESAVDGVHSWFNMSKPSTLTTFKGRTYGATVPGFRVVTSSGNTMNIDPDHGKTLAANLQATVKAGATVTLVEGHSDWEENASTWRAAAGTYDQTRYDYPSQMLNILRKYSKNPFPTNLRVEAEAADAYSDTTTGNEWNVYRKGDIDVQPTGDSGGGWNVGKTASGEWLEWREVPLQGTVTLKARVATPNSSAQFRFVVDGKAGPTTTVTNTGDWQTYKTVDAGSFTFPSGSYHTVRLEFLGGSVNVNYWTN